MPLTFESTIQGPTLYARRKDDRVLCVDKDCGFPLAWILQPNPKLLEKEPFVWFPPGWVWQRDGTWAVSATAQKRLRGDRLHPKGQTPQAKHVLYGELVGRHPNGWKPYLPAVAWCPKCPQGRQTLDAVRLGVGDISDAMARVKSPCGFPACHRLVERKKAKDGRILTPTYCQEHEGEMSGLSSADRHQAGYPRRLYHVEAGSLRVLATPDELERWKREPLRFQ